MRIEVSRHGERRRQVVADLPTLGFVVHQGSSIDQLASVRRQPDVILLEYDVADEAVVDRCLRLRATCGTPIVVVAARIVVQALHQAYEAGMDDFVVDPIGLDELATRLVHAARPQRVNIPARPPDSRLAHGPLSISQDSRTVAVRGVRVKLRPMEYRLLVLLARRAGQVSAKETLIAGLWPTGARNAERTLEVHINSLRKKLAVPGLIVTVHGIGYRLISDESYRRIDPDDTGADGGPGPRFPAS